MTELVERIALARDAAGDAADLLPAKHPMRLAAELERSGALTPTALHLPAKLSLDEYEAIGRMLGQVDSATKWWIGDFLLTGETYFGEHAYQAMESLGISEDTRMRYVNVAQRVPPERRRPELSWSHHKNITSLEPEEQNEWLERAVADDWSAHDLFEELKAQRHSSSPPVATGADIRSAALDVLAVARRQRGGYLIPTTAFESFKAVVEGGQ